MTHDHCTEHDDRCPHGVIVPSECMPREVCDDCAEDAAAEMQAESIGK